MIIVTRFTAPWCQPCKLLTPIMKMLEDRYGDLVVFATVDIESHPETATEHNVRSIPTVLFHDASGGTGRLVGIKPMQDYIDAIDLRLKVDAGEENV
jgi:thioredoxin-like negative regulator of GroEL